MCVGRGGGGEGERHESLAAKVRGMLIPEQLISAHDHFTAGLSSPGIDPPASESVRRKDVISSGPLD